MQRMSDTHPAGKYIARVPQSQTTDKQPANKIPDDPISVLLTTVEGTYVYTYAYTYIYTSTAASYLFPNSWPASFVTTSSQVRSVCPNVDFKPFGRGPIACAKPEQTVIAIIIIMGSQKAMNLLAPCR
jgi:hypothetical protein